VFRSNIFQEQSSKPTARSPQSNLRRRIYKQFRRTDKRSHYCTHQLSGHLYLF